MARQIRLERIVGRAPAVVALALILSIPWIAAASVPRRVDDPSRTHDSNPPARCDPRLFGSWRPFVLAGTINSTIPDAIHIAGNCSAAPAGISVAIACKDKACDWTIGELSFGPSEVRETGTVLKGPVNDHYCLLSLEMDVDDRGLMTAFFIRECEPEARSLIVGVYERAEESKPSEGKP